MTQPHVIVVRLDNAGDVLLSGPAVRAVAAGARRVTYVCGPAGRAAAELLPGVDEVIVFDASWCGFEPPDTRPAEIARIVDQLRRRRADCAVVLTSFHQSPLPMALLLRLAGVGTIGATSVDHPGTLLDVRHRPVDGHEVQQSLSLVGALGFHLPRPVDDRLAIRFGEWTAAPFDQPYVVVHPGASVPARGIPTRLTRPLVERLLDDGWCVAVTGSAGECDVTSAACPASDRVVDLAGRHDLAGLAGVLGRAAALVSGNTGPAHLAAAVATPVVSVFAPVVPMERWRPWRVPSVCFGEQDIACAGCRSRICPLPDQPCLAGVSADSLADAVATLARPLQVVAR